MRGLLLLLVTRFFARVDTTVEGPSTSIRTIENTIPFLLDLLSTFRLVRLPALLFILQIATQDILLDLSTIAPRLNPHLTSATKSLVTRPLTKVLTTRHHLPTNNPTTPPILVVRINTFTLMTLPSTKARLLWTQLSTGRTRPTMTDQIARMRAVLW